MEGPIPLTNQPYHTKRSIKSRLKRIQAVLGVDPLWEFFYHTLGSQDAPSVLRWGLIPHNYYEFGTGWGDSLRKYLSAVRSYCRAADKDDLGFNVVVFDSFEGLPESVAEADRNPNWSKGVYAYRLDHITRLVHRSGFRGKFRPVKGFFGDSLTNELRNELKVIPPSIVNIDVDYYSSAATVLGFLGPILQNGTILYFDDIYDFFGSPKKGELRAIAEFTASNAVSLTPYYLHGISYLFGKTFIFSRD
jgi:hypothetical protein